MAKTEHTETTNLLIEVKQQLVIQVALLGAIVGVAAWLLAAVVRHVILEPLFCGDTTNSMCVGAASNSGMVALVIASIAGLMGLIRLGAYRPLLIVIAAAITLWGLAGWTSGLSWLEAILWSAILFAISYVVFLWLARIRPFMIAAIVIVAVVVLARWIPVL